MLSAVSPCNISQCFIQSPLLFPPLSVYLPTLTHSFPCPSPSSALKSPPIIGMFFEVFCVLFDYLEHFSTWWYAYPEWLKYTLISLMRLRLTTIVVANAVFVVIFSCTHEYVFVMCLPYFCFCHASTFHTMTKHPIGSLRARKSFLQFFHLSALISFSFVAR